VADTTVAYQQDCALRQARDAHEAQLIAQRVELFAARPLNWVTVGASHFVLPLGVHGMLHVRPVGAQWRASLHRPDGRRDHIGTRPDMAYAVGAAEDFARQLGVHQWLDRDASWRRGPASAKQLAALRRMRLRVAPAVTRGEASDLIAARIARFA
jgi:hypothetical protein